MIKRFYKLKFFNTSIFSYIYKSLNFFEYIYIIPKKFNIKGMLIRILDCYHECILFWEKVVKRQKKLFYIMLNILEKIDKNLDFMNYSLVYARIFKWFLKFLNKVKKNNLSINGFMVQSYKRLLFNPYLDLFHNDSFLTFIYHTSDYPVKINKELIKFICNEEDIPENDINQTRINEISYIEHKYLYSFKYYMNYIDFNYPYANLCSFEYISEKMTSIYSMKCEELSIFRDFLELNYVKFKIDYSIINDLLCFFPFYNSIVCKTVIGMENFIEKSIKITIDMYNDKIRLEKELKKKERKLLRDKIRLEKNLQKELEKKERKLLRDKIRLEKNLQKELEKKERKLLRDKIRKKKKEK